MDKFAHELEPGDACAPLDFVVTPEMNEQFLYAQENFDPCYVDAEGNGKAEVHPTLLLQMSANTKSPSFKLAPNTGSILAEASTEFLNPALIGKNLRITWQVTDSYEKRGRRYYIMEASMVDEDDRPILRRQLHLTFPNQST